MAPRKNQRVANHVKPFMQGAVIINDKEQQQAPLWCRKQAIDAIQPMGSDIYAALCDITTSSLG